MPGKIREVADGEMILCAGFNWQKLFSTVTFPAMQLIRRRLLAALAIWLAGNPGVFAQTNAPVATTPVYNPDYSHSGEPLPDGVLNWDALLKAADVTNGQEAVKFSFVLTNATTNFVTILSVHPSCGCTTAEMPPVPWMIPAGQGGEIKLNVDLRGKTENAGTLFKQVNVVSDRGSKNLMLRINVLPPPKIVMTEAQRAAGITAAKADRQAVFKGDCRSCHVKNVEGKYGQQVFKAVCSICHEAEHRASFVPDLANLPVRTSEEFWRTWITLGKPGSLMPAFAKSQGGPLDDLQIASLAAYLNAVYPPRDPQTNAPAAAPAVTH